jgi:hypothetical protein
MVKVMVMVRVHRFAIRPPMAPASPRMPLSPPPRWPATLRSRRRANRWASGSTRRNMTFFASEKRRTPQDLGAAAVAQVVNEQSAGTLRHRRRARDDGVVERHFFSSRAASGGHLLFAASLSSGEDTMAPTIGRRHIRPGARLHPTVNDLCVLMDAVYIAGEVVHDLPITPPFQKHSFSLSCVRYPIEVIIPILGPFYLAALNDPRPVSYEILLRDAPHDEPNPPDSQRCPSSEHLAPSGA